MITFYAEMPFDRFGRELRFVGVGHGDFVCVVQSWIITLTLWLKEVLIFAPKLIGFGPGCLPGIFSGGRNLLLCKFLLLYYCFRTKFQGGAKVFRGANCLKGGTPCPLWEKARASGLIELQIFSQLTSNSTLISSLTYFCSWLMRVFTAGLSSESIVSIAYVLLN